MPYENDPCRRRDPCNAVFLYGMCEYLKEANIKDKKILFIHTGGTPLFFNDIDVINL